jgi:uncharacterized protein (TIGR03067 family)
VVYAESAGQAVPARELAQIGFELSQNTIIRDTEPKPATDSVNMAKTPIEIDIKRDDGHVTRGILDLRGDTQRLCVLNGAGDRPTMFETGTETLNASDQILKRVLLILPNTFRGFPQTSRMTFIGAERPAVRNIRMGH